MAISFVSEFGDQRGGSDVENTVGEHVKVISAEYYKRNDAGVVSNVSIQNAIDSLSTISVYTPKGSADVSTLNGGIPGVQPGWAYELSDSGTLVDGNVSVVAGDTVAWDGTGWFKLKTAVNPKDLPDTASASDLASGNYLALGTQTALKKLDAGLLMQETAQNALAGNLVHAFNPDRTNENPYTPDDCCVKDGKVYVFTRSHYGAWNLSDVERYTLIDEFGKVVYKKLVLHDSQAAEHTEWGVGKRIRGDNSSVGTNENYTITRTYAVAPGDYIVFRVVCGAIDGGNSFPIFKASTETLDDNTTFESLGYYPSNGDDVWNPHNFAYHNNSSETQYVCSNNRTASFAAPLVYTDAEYRQDAPTLAELAAYQASFVEKANYTLESGIVAPQATNVALNGYTLYLNGTVSQSENYAISKAFAVKPGETISFSNVTNNNSYPLFKTNSATVTLESTFQILGSGSSSAPKYINGTDSEVYVVVCFRKPNGYPSYSISAYGNDAPSYADYRAMKMDCSGISFYDALATFPAKGGCINYAGSWNNSSNWEHYEIVGEPWMKKVRTVVTNDNPARSSVAFYSDRNFSTSDPTKYLIKTVMHYGTDVESVDDVPEGCRMIIVSSYKANGRAKKIDIYGEWDKFGILYFNDIRETYPKILAAKKASILNGVSQTPVLSLLHFSDIHGAQANLERIVEFRNYYGTLIDDIIDTGDDTLDQFSDPDIFAGVEGAEKILRCIGNHDNAVKEGSVYDFSAKTASEDYAKFFSPYIDNWNVVSNPDVCYYYKDYASSSVRLVVMDVMHNDSAQESWLSDVLDDALENNLSVIIAEHYTSGIVPFDTSFNTASPYSMVPSAWLNLVDSFISNSGEFVCWLCGDEHADAVGTINSHPNQVMIVIDLASATRGSTHSMTPRSMYTRMQDLFNIVCVDTYAKLLKVVRIGANEKSTLEKIDTMVINYATRTLIR